MVLMYSLQIYAQVTQDWAARYNGPVNGPERVSSMAVDSSGNVYVTGRISVAIPAAFDIATIKYNSSGIQQWVQRYNGPLNNSDESHSIAVDRAGNVYVAGYTVGVWGLDTNLDYVTIKYSSTGEQLWLQNYDGNGNSHDVASSVGVDDSGNVYVTGNGYASGNGHDYITIKYNASGVLQWDRSYEGTGTAGDFASFLKLDSEGNVYVTGDSWGAGTREDYVTIKYNSMGVQQWVQRYDGTGHDLDNPSSLEVDKSGNVYVTGRSRGPNPVGLEYATVKYNTFGIQEWAKRYSEPAVYADVANSVAVDDSGNVYVTGESAANGFNFDYATVKYNSSGDQQWVRRFNGSGNGHDRAVSVVVDGTGDVYVTGYSYSLLTDYDYVTVKYNSSGMQQWVKNYNGTGNLDDIAGFMKVDRLGNIYVTGDSKGMGTDFDYATVKLSPQKSFYLTSLVQGFYNSSTNTLISDTMRVYLRDANSPFAVIDSSISILDSSGNGTFYFSNAADETSYYISLKHRNSIETWSASGVNFINGSLNYDFSSASERAYGNNMVNIDSYPVKFGLFSGDVNQNGSIDPSDVLLVYNDAGNFVTGYESSDLNGDRTADLTDVLISYTNSVNLVSVKSPVLDF